MSRTSNEHFRDALIRHQIGLLRLSLGIWERAIDTLDAGDPRLELLIRRYLDTLQDKTTDLKSPLVIGRLDDMRKEIEDLRDRHMDEVLDQTKQEGIGIVLGEWDFLAAATIASLPFIVKPIIPSSPKRTAGLIVGKEPFQGRTLEVWLSDLAAVDTDRIMDQVTMGLQAGETTEQIVARIFGSAALANADGILAKTRNDLLSVIRTAVIHLSAQGRKGYVAANEDLFSSEVFIAVLDSRTTAICRSLDHKKYKLGVGPIPPLHYNCRSIRIPVFLAEIAGSRTAKEATERMLLNEFADEQGIEYPANRDALPRGMKGKYDAFLQQRLREIVGTVPKDLAYPAWLAGQSDEFQDEVLGKTRGLLFRKGGLTLDRFVDSTGKQYTIAQLAKFNRQAFIRAGLDPGSYGA